MNATQWNEKWEEGLAELDDISVRLERVSHKVEVTLEKLDAQATLEEIKPKRGYLLRTLLGGAR